MNPAKHPSSTLGVGEKGVGLLTYEQARKKEESISERARILVRRVCVCLCLVGGVGCACSFWLMRVVVCVAVCCSILHCVAVCCCVLQCVVVCVQCVAMIDVYCV